MAHSFFGFNTSLSGLEPVDEPDLDEEEEYDALNDETFGADAFQGDWEEDHTKFAEVTENSRNYKNSYNSEKDDELDLEASLSQLVLEGEEEDEDEDLDKQIKKKNSKSNSQELSSKFSFDYIAYNSSPTWNIDENEKIRLLNRHKQGMSPSHQQKPQQVQSSLPKPSPTRFLPPQLPRIPTVQELERDIIEKNKQSNNVDKENKNKTINQSLNQDKNHYPAVSNNSIMHNSNSNIQFQNLNVQQQNAHNRIPHPPVSNKFPPGFGPPHQGVFNQPQPQSQPQPQLQHPPQHQPQPQPQSQPPPQQQEMMMMRNNQNMQIPLRTMIFPPTRLPPMFLQPPQMLPPHPFLLTQNPRLLAHHPLMRFMPPHPLIMQSQQPPQQQQQQQIQQQNQKQQNAQKPVQNKIQNNPDYMRNGQISRNQQSAGHPQQWLHNLNRRPDGQFDEYAGLMNNREKQWLLNIQIIQLASDKPHVDDYYYMAWSKKQEKGKKSNENRSGSKKEKQVREPFFANNRTDANNRERRDSERETLTPVPRAYVPLQFENSLGKLQCGSVTAPRKIIDLDVVPERQVETAPSTSHKDSRKTKKILLEIEKLYLWTMDLEDIDNNLTNTKDVTQSTEEPPPDKPKLLEQIMTTYLCEDKFVNFMCVRKGKTLLLRILPHLNYKDHFEHLTNLWCRLVKSVSLIIRRDQNDGVLLQLYPFFKNWIDSVDCTVLSIVASYLLTANVSNQGKKSSRAVSPNPGKSVLSNIITTTFGVSIVCCILSKGEAIYPTLDEKEKVAWTNFMLNFIKHMTSMSNLENQIPTPIDPLPGNVLAVILNRSTGLHIQDYATAKRVLTALNKDKSRS